ncbi:MAG TPA: group II intron reverse transcriptase/maturase [Anaerolineae bacterium]|nr:group II intron reverse transcriptase/maturase [Anaerolineae bacterium]HOR01529.1 group II intron reverse transcriptase/maturase [Anaerolineae bacterium]HPL29962.1 group II intron reverse transcriptase/maturase [Anaerolineae bacterium]
MGTALTPMYEWKTLPWNGYERKVFKLQKRIYQAARRGDTRTVHRLQRLLTKSWSARCLAVRRVTQENQGKRTAGIDGVKALSPAERMALTNKLNLRLKARPTRRVWIPKPGTQEKRALGIPVMEDRALQTLVKLALEPEWEAHLEPNSYGFRPGRSCHDAIDAIYISITQQPKYVLDADIAKCFDRIDHQQLLEKLQTAPTIRRMIKAWLQAGVMDGKDLFPTMTGTPQGGPLSPLLANIALHGLETAIKEAFPRKIYRDGHGKSWQPTVIRYADDFIILHRDLAVIEKSKQIAAAWLADMGLELKPSKTHITHTLKAHNGTTGFDFLGFNVRQYPVGKTHSGRNKEGALLGFKTLIKPSKEAIRRHNEALREIIKHHRAAPQAALITRLNPVIRGWTQYYSTVVAKKVFASLGHQLYLKLRRWARHRHPNWNARKIAGKYWRLEKGTWEFAPKEGTSLYQHAHTPITRHIKVQGSRSPYDGDWVYWASRLGRRPELPRRVAKLLQRQKGRCTRCGLYFNTDDKPEVDHIIPRAEGGEDRYDNWQLLHRHCHDAKTAAEAQAAA